MSNIYIAFLLGTFVGLLIGNKDFRSKVLSLIFKQNIAKQQVVGTDKLYACAGGGQYHIRACELLQGNAFNAWEYREVNPDYIVSHHLRPCECIEKRKR